MNDVTSPLAKDAASSVSGIARTLITAGKLDKATAQSIQAAAQKSGSSFIAELVASGAVSALTLAQSISSAFGAPLLDLHALRPDALPTTLLDDKICQEFQLVVLGKRNHALVIATADPSNQDAADKIKFATQRRVEWVVVEFDKLVKFLENSTPSEGGKYEAVFADSEFQDQEETPEETEATEVDSEVDDSPIVRFCKNAA